MRSAVLAFTIAIQGAAAPAWAAKPPRLPPMPPDAPVPGEVVVHTRDRVAIRCAEMNDEVNSGTGAKLLREVVTRSWRWGTIYRADSAASMGPDDPPMLWRTVCSKRGVLRRPLEMFDPRENIPPLP